MSNYLIIKVSNNIKRFINKCKKYNIELINVDYIDKNNIIVKIYKKDYDLIKQYNYYSEIIIFKKTGIDLLKEKILHIKYLIIIFITCIVGMYFISTVILKINVIHSNKKIRELVYEELSNYGIKKYSIKKDFNELDTIKNKILENNKDKLEWISITNVGMTYVIRVEERIIDNIVENNEYCNIISNKEAVITKIYSNSGEILVSVNDLVKKDELLIDGKIKLEDNIKGYTCSSGQVFGNVWYNTNISIKREYKEKKYTNKKRINIMFFNKELRTNKYNLFDKEYIIKTKYFSIYKEKEYKLNTKIYNEKEGINKALNELEEKFKVKIRDNGKIIKEKIINQNINKDTISLDVFVVTEELISKQVILDINEEE